MIEFKIESIQIQENHTILFTLENGSHCLPHYFKANLFTNSKSIGVFDFFSSGPFFWISIRNNDVNDYLENPYLKVNLFGILMSMYDHENDHNQSHNLWFALTENELNKYITLEKLKSRDGYTREKALKAFNASLHLNDHEILMALLARSNDWVEPIRLLAASVLLDYLTLSDQAFVMEHWSNIYHLKECKRSNHDRLIEHIEVYLSKNPTILIHHLTTNKKIAQHCYFIIQKFGILSNLELLAMVNTLKNVAVQRYLSCQVAKLDHEKFKMFEPMLIKSRNTDIKRECLRLYVKFDMDKINKIQHYLFDKTTSVAETAWWLAGKHNVDALGIYEAVLINHNNTVPHHVRVAIKMFSHFKLEALSHLIKEIIFSAHVFGLKRSAIKAMLKFDKNSAEQILIKLCMSQDEKEVKLASDFLEKRYLIKKFTSGIPVRDLETLYYSITNAKTNAGKKILIKLIGLRHDWGQIHLCLLLYNKLKSVEYKELGVLEQLMKMSIRFRSVDDYEPKVREWVKNNRNCLAAELYYIFNSSYHGKKFLETLPT